MYIFIIIFMNLFLKLEIFWNQSELNTRDRPDSRKLSIYLMNVIYFKL